MLAISLVISNYFSGSAGTSNGTLNFTDLSGQFTPALVGSTLTTGGNTYNIVQFLTSTTIALDGVVPVGTGLSWKVGLPVINGQNVIVNESPTHGYVMEFSATASEGDRTQNYTQGRKVTLSFNLGDGSQPSSVSGVGSISNVYTNRYAPGLYRVVATASNANYPTPQSKSVFFNLNVQTEAASTLTQNPALVGPVLPSDSGYPDAEQWNLNIDVNDKVITSNVKNLITTVLGERLMYPAYGTAIRTTIFDMDPTTIQNFLQDQITTALSAYEPRAQLLNFSFDFPSGSRTGTLLMQVLSLVTRQTLSTSVVING